MKISDRSFKIDLSEEDVIQALEYWLYEQHNQDIAIKHLKHKVGSRTQDCGNMEIDVPYQEGLELTCEDVK